MFIFLPCFDLDSWLYRARHIFRWLRQKCEARKESPRIVSKNLARTIYTIKVNQIALPIGFIWVIWYECAISNGYVRGTKRNTFFILFFIYANGKTHRSHTNTNWWSMLFQCVIIYKQTEHLIYWQEKIT